MADAAFISGGKVIVVKDPRIQVHEMSYIDGTVNSELSPERQLELLKNNICLALKRIHNYRATQPIETSWAIRNCTEQLEYLTSVKYERPKD